LSQLDFMSAEHHLVRNYVVRALPSVGKPLTPDFIGAAVGLATDRVIAILSELERHLTFLYRDSAGAVTWAYPVTVDRTPHHLTFSTGEQIYAAWGVDAIATPFVQGRLRGEPLSVVVETECAHCGAQLRLEVDNNLDFRTLTDGAEPLVYVPQVDFARLTDPSIIDAFWRRSVFFWSEEHTSEHRARSENTSGAYRTLQQMAQMTVTVQGALFPAS
jgi:hypothetical protein